MLEENDLEPQGRYLSMPSVPSILPLDVRVITFLRNIETPSEQNIEDGIPVHEVCIILCWNQYLSCQRAY
jgi:hypothetical protein